MTPEQAKFVETYFSLGNTRGMLEYPAFVEWFDEQIQNATGQQLEVICARVCMFCNNVASGIKDVGPAERNAGYSGGFGGWFHRNKLGDGWYSQECFASAIRAYTIYPSP